MSADDHACRPVVDESGAVLGHARVAPDLGPEGEAALLAVVQAAIRLQAERDAVDPVGAAERARRQEAGRARIAGRMRRLSGE